MWPGGKVETLDEEKLKEAMEEGLISDKFVKTVREKLVEIIGNLHADKN